MAEESKDRSTTESAVAGKQSGAKPVPAAGQSPKAERHPRSRPGEQAARIAKSVTRATAVTKAQSVPQGGITRRVFLSIFSPLSIAWIAFAASSSLGLGALIRFLFPNVLFEPPSSFKVGVPEDFPPETVDARFKAKFGVWIVNHGGILYALRAVCTHLGCPPNWLSAEQKFKCPCHGSGFYISGVNFEGPAPRPLERFAISIAEDGQVLVDKSRIFQEEKGQWNDLASFVKLA